MTLKALIAAESGWDGFTASICLGGGDDVDGVLSARGITEKEAFQKLCRLIEGACGDVTAEGSECVYQYSPRHNRRATDHKDGKIVRLKS